LLLLLLLRLHIQEPRVQHVHLAQVNATGLLPSLRKCSRKLPQQPHMLLQI
jgi:hypothetical protein